MSVVGMVPNDVAVTRVVTRPRRVPRRVGGRHDLFEEFVAKRCFELPVILIAEWLVGPWWFALFYRYSGHADGLVPAGRPLRTCRAGGPAAEREPCPTLRTSPDPVPPRHRSGPGNGTTQRSGHRTRQENGRLPKRRRGLVR